MTDGRDPFVSLLDLKKQKLEAMRSQINLSELSLKGIIWNDANPVAIINDEIVTQGEDWKGFKVEYIGREKVTLNDGLDSYDLTLPEELQLEQQAGLSKSASRLPEDMSAEGESGMPSKSGPGFSQNRASGPKQENMSFPFSQRDTRRRN